MWLQSSSILITGANETHIRPQLWHFYYSIFFTLSIQFTHACFLSSFMIGAQIGFVGKDIYQVSLSTVHSWMNHLQFTWKSLLLKRVTVDAFLVLFWPNTDRGSTTLRGSHLVTNYCFRQFSAPFCPISCAYPHPVMHYSPPFSTSYAYPTSHRLQVSSKGGFNHETAIFAKNSHFESILPLLTPLVYLPSPPRLVMIKRHYLPLSHQYSDQRNLLWQCLKQIYKKTRFS